MTIGTTNKAIGNVNYWHLHVQGQVVAFHMSNLPARVVVTWPKIAGAMTAAKLFVRMEGYANDLSCCFLNYLCW